MLLSLLALGSGSAEGQGSIFVADDSFTVEAEQSSRLDVLANDLGANLRLVAAEPVDPAAPVTVYPDSGRLVFVPEERFAGVAELIYTVTDGASQAEGRVTVTVTATLVDDVVFTIDGHPVVFDPLPNDRGATTVVDVGAPEQGRLHRENTWWVFQPEGVGVFSVPYEAVDSGGGAYAGAVTVHVRSDERGLPAPQIEATGRADGKPIQVALGAQSAGVVAVRDGAYGAATLVGGTLVYEPRKHHVGEDSVTYFVADGSGAWGRGVVRLTLVHPDLQRRFGFETLPPVDDLESTPAHPLGSSLMELTAEAAVGAGALDLSGSAAPVWADVELAAGHGAVSAWVRVPVGLAQNSPPQSTAMTIFAAGDAAAGETAWSLQLEPESATDGRLVVRQGSLQLASPLLEWKADGWHHVAFTWSPWSRRVFRDGELVASTAGADPLSAPPAADTRALAVGGLLECGVGSCSAGFAGWIDQVRVYNRQLGELAIAQQAALEDPGLSFCLEMDDLSDELLVANGRGPGDEVELVLAGSAPFKVKSADHAVGLGFGRGGGFVRYAPDSGQVFDPESGWLHLEVQLPAQGLAVETGEVVLFEDPEAVRRLVLSPRSSTSFSATLYELGEPVLRAETVEAEPGARITLAVAWRGTEQELLVDGKVWASAPYEPGLPVVRQLAFPLAKGFSLFGAYVGGGGYLPVYFLYMTSDVGLWVPDFGGGPLLTKLRGDRVATWGAVICPFQPGCRRPGVLLAPTNREHLAAVLERGKVPQDRQVWWWNRRSRKYEHRVGKSFEGILAGQRIETNQFVGTGGSRKYPGLKDSYGIGEHPWTGSLASGRASGLDCRKWTSGLLGVGGTMGSAFLSNRGWLDLVNYYSPLWHDCVVARPIRCACASKKNFIRWPFFGGFSDVGSKLFEDGFEPGDTDCWGPGGR